MSYKDEEELVVGAEIVDVDEDSLLSVDDTDDSLLDDDILSDDELLDVDEEDGDEFVGLDGSSEY